MSSRGSSTTQRKKRSGRRRLRDMMMPLLSAGLLKFPESKEYEKVRIDPKFLIIFSIMFIGLILALDLALAHI